MNNRPPPFYFDYDDPSSMALVVQLHKAVQFGNREVVQDILYSRVPLNYKNSDYGNAAIHFATQNLEHDYEVIKLLISRGADVNILNNLDRSPLHLALMRNNCNYKVIKFLLECGADVNHLCNFKKSALHFAVMSANCKVEVLDLLLTRGAEIDHIDKMEDTPLLCAVMNPNCTQEVIEWFVENGSNISVTNINKQSILHYATENRHFNLAILKWFLKKKVPLDVLDVMLRSPLYQAIHNRCDPSMVHCLLNAGATILRFGQPTLRRAFEICKSAWLNRICYDWNGDFVFWDDSSTENLDLLIRYTVLHYINYNINRYLNDSYPKFESVLFFINCCRHDVWKMDKREIIPGVTFREFLTGQKCLRFNASATEGELCDINHIFHCLAVDEYPLYIPVIAKKLDIHDIWKNLRIYSMESRTVFLDCHSVAHIVGYLSSVDVINAIIGFHSRMICYECRNVD